MELCKRFGQYNMSPFPVFGRFGLFLIFLPCFEEIYIFNANSLRIGQMPHSVESDLDCLDYLKMLPFMVCQA